MRVIGILLAIVTLLPGCASMQDFHYEATNALRSQLAWYRAAPNVRQGLCPSDYGKGWKMGYFSVTMGGGSHPPSFPPAQYWSAHYQTHAGQAEIAAWYRGYQDGAIRAERRGAGNFHYLHAHDSRSHDSGPHVGGTDGGGPVVETAPPSPPAAEPEPIPTGTTSIRHSQLQPRNSIRTADARGNVAPADAVPARILAARPEVQPNASRTGQAIKPPSRVPTDYFPPPPALSQPTSLAPAEGQPNTPTLRPVQSPPQPTSSAPAEGQHFFGTATPAAAQGVETSSWTVAQDEAPGQTASEKIKGWWQVRRLPPVLPPLFSPPQPDGIADKP